MSVRYSPNYYINDLERLDNLAKIIEKSFQLHGYLKVSTPLLENPEPFLDRSGEQVRSSIYIFRDPQENEVCLRPEMTIPVVGLFSNNRDMFSAPISRLYYWEEVLRFMTGRDEHSNQGQFSQVGLERFGGKDTLFADLEILGLAKEVFERTYPDVLFKIGNSSFARDFIQSLPIDESVRNRLIRCYHDKKKLNHMLTNLENRNGLTEKPPSKPGSKSFLGERTQENIEKRLLYKSRARKYPKEILDCIRKFSTIEGTAHEAIPEMRSLLENTGVPVPNSLNDLEKLANALPNSVEFLVTNNFSRNLEYYSGTVFEVVDKNGKKDKFFIAGGGRYDIIMKKNPKVSDVSAIGFGIHLQNLNKLIDKQNITSKKPPIFYIHSKTDNKNFVSLILKRIRNFGFAAVNDGLDSVTVTDLELKNKAKAVLEIATPKDMRIKFGDSVLSTNSNDLEKSLQNVKDQC